MRTRYSRWDGTQEPFAGDFDVGEILDEISDDVLGYGAEFGLRRLMQRGVHGRMRGLADIQRRIRELRQRMEEGLNLEGPLAEVHERLNEILGMERATLSGIENEDARMREAFLDSLPSHPAGSIKELNDYRFVNPEAQEKFDQLVREIQQEVLNSYFKHLSGAIQGITPEQLQRLREMLQALNEMIRAHERGDSYDFQGFMQQYGDFFPENPKNLEELLEVLARRMAAMSRLLASLTPEQRRQLEALAGAVMEDLDIAFQMDQLQQELRHLMPHLPWDEPALGLGEEQMQFSAAVDAIERMSELEELEDAMAGDYAGSHIDDIDEDKLQRALGEESVRDVRRLKQIEKALEEAGILTRTKGRLELTARGARRLGERALVKVFEDLRRDRSGPHESRESGGQAEPTGATRPWKFGDTGDISVQKTVFNAVVRSAGEGYTSRGSIALAPDDFELIEAETRTRTATALLLDMSYSMPLRGNWVAAKKMALALHALIEGKYPQDRLYLVGFSDYARKLDPSDLVASRGIEPVYGTNMQHAFILARRLLAEHPRATKQVIMVTDGEPTAHLEDIGSPNGPEVFFSWPPVRETIHKTLAEAIRLSNTGITLNVFMLESAPGLVRFMQQLAQRTGGRVFQTQGRDLGQFVLKDYVRRRRRGL